MIHLGVNIDHIATVREARGEGNPDLYEAAHVVESAGADGITIHLREDRRHIQDHDLKTLRKRIKTRLNLEMALSQEIIKIALKVKPDQITLVPEKREELTTEGGLNVLKYEKKIKQVVTCFHKKNIRVSLFIDPVLSHVRKSESLGADAIELHTGSYAHAFRRAKAEGHIKKLQKAAVLAHQLGLSVYAGHGLDYKNVGCICNIPHMSELNIGHSIVSRALFVGLKQAVKEMKKAIKTARK